MQLRTEVRYTFRRSPITWSFAKRSDAIKEAVKAHRRGLRPTITRRKDPKY